jgi:hypothetical protein
MYWQASVGIVSVDAWPHTGQVIVDCSSTRSSPSQRGAQRPLRNYFTADTAGKGPQHRNNGNVSCDEQANAGPERNGHNNASGHSLKHSGITLDPGQPVRERRAH